VSRVDGDGDGDLRPIPRRFFFLAGGGFFFPPVDQILGLSFHQRFEVLMPDDFPGLFLKSCCVALASSESLLFFIDVRLYPSSFYCFFFFCGLFSNFFSTSPQGAPRLRRRIATATSSANPQPAAFDQTSPFWPKSRRVALFQNYPLAPTRVETPYLSISNHRCQVRGSHHHELKLVAPPFQPPKSGLTPAHPPR